MVLLAALAAALLLAATGATTELEDAADAEAVSTVLTGAAGYPWIEEEEAGFPE